MGHKGGLFGCVWWFVEGAVQHEGNHKTKQQQKKKKQKNKTKKKQKSSEQGCI
jgi:hypothetical protein